MGARIEGNRLVTKGQHAQLHLWEVAEWSHSETKSVTKNWRKGCGHEQSVVQSCIVGYDKVLETEGGKVATQCDGLRATNCVFKYGQMVTFVMHILQ